MQVDVAFLEFVVGRAQLLVRGLQLVPRRLELLVGGLEFLVAGDGLLVGGAQFLEGALVVFEDVRKTLPRRLDLALHLADPTLEPACLGPTEEPSAASWTSGCCAVLAAALGIVFDELDKTVGLMEAGSVDWDDVDKDPLL